MSRDVPLPQDFDDVLVADQNVRLAGEAAAFGGALFIALGAMLLARLRRRRSSPG